LQIHAVHNGDVARWLGTVADIHQSQYQRGGESDTNKGLKGHHSGKNDVLICNKLLNISSYIISFFVSYICHPRVKNLLLFLVGHDIKQTGEDKKSKQKFNLET
jgi:hypothetical protein